MPHRAAVLGALRCGDVDLGILLEPQAEEMPEVAIRRIDREPIPTLVIAPAGYSLGQPEWANLAQEGFFLFEKGCTYGDRVEQYLLAEGKPRLTRVDAIEAIRSCVETGLGLA
ncbi:LysR family transcriptional regulator substrate-binding protein [Streptomyces sp. NPDC053069]|uniref:LysR family transcriptional regulator substrate-binding protein n=1 Tax=Streptomyces sp. NPDC053069 TaxID=3365695 RepID=UPI0037CE1EEE